MYSKNSSKLEFFE